MILAYVSKLPPNYGGIAYGPFVLILKKYRHDAGLHAHERFHVKQCTNCGQRCMLTRFSLPPIHPTGRIALANTRATSRGTISSIFLLKTPTNF